MYLNFFRHKSNVYVKHIRNGRIVYDTIKHYCSPMLVRDTNGANEGFYDMFDRPLTVINENMNFWESKKLMDQFDSSNFPVYGYNKIENAYVYDNFKNQNIDMSKIHKWTIDIETECERGFPDPMRADEIINMFGLSSSRDERYHVFYVYEHEIEIEEYEDVVLHHFTTEAKMLNGVLNFMAQDYPDVITGWNIDGFDIPYIHNRIIKILGPESVKRLSPFGIIETKEGHDKYGKDTIYVTIRGISIIDYQKAYKLFVKKPRARYSLDYIGEVEVKEKKLRHHSGIPGHLLYKKYFADGLKYNVQDIKLVDKIDKKNKLIALMQMLAYETFVNYDDVFSKMRMIENKYYMYLRDNNKFFEWSKNSSSGSAFEGAAVKDTIAGKYRWVVSFDVTSEYPSLIRALNISPETIVNGYMAGFSVNDLINIKITDIYKASLERNVCIAGNGYTFSKEKQGFMPAVVEEMFNKRAQYKAQKVEADIAHDTVKANEYNIRQLAVKEWINSAYGVMGNAFFRFYDIRIAEAITLSGQAMIGWIIKDVNTALNKMFNDDKDRVVASDTDSIYVDLNDVVVKKFGQNYNDEDALEFITEFSDKTMNNLIEKSITRFAKYLNAFDASALDMKRESVADDVIFVAKKHYIMSVRDEEGAKYEKGEKIVIKGLEAIKGATPTFCQEQLKKIYKTLLFEGQTEYYDTLNSAVKAFRELAPDEIAENSGVNTISKSTERDGTLKKGAHITVKAATAYNNRIKQMKLTENYPFIKDGDKMKYVKLKSPNPLKTSVFAWLDRLPDEFSSYKQFMDYDEQIEKFIEGPSQRVADVCGIKNEMSSDAIPWI